MKLNAEQIMEDYREATASGKERTRYNLGLVSGQLLTVSYLDKWLAGHRENDMEYNFSFKGTRPWEIINVTKRLDPTQVWIGYEFETGFDDKNQYDKAVNWLWNNAENFVIDREGVGEYPCEFTFSPVNLDQFMSKDYVIDKFLVKLNEIGETERILDEWGAQVGMHVNMSGPNIRNCTDLQALANLLSCSIGALSHEQARTLFGRQPYGYIYERSANGQVWLEGKLFNSTHDINKWNEYKAVSNNLALLADSLAGDKRLLGSITTDDTYQEWCEDGNTSKVVSNLYEILMGETQVGDADVIDNPEYEQEDEDYPF